MFEYQNHDIRLGYHRAIIEHPIRSSVRPVVVEIKQMKND